MIVCGCGLDTEQALIGLEIAANNLKSYKNTRSGAGDGNRTHVISLEG